MHSFFEPKKDKKILVNTQPFFSIFPGTRDTSLKHARKNAKKKLCIQQIFLSSKNGCMIYISFHFYLLIKVILFLKLNLKDIYY